MRLRQDRKFFLVLAACFAASIVGRTDLPGEGVLPSLSASWFYLPLLSAAGASEPGELSPEALELLAVKDYEIQRLKTQLENQRRLAAYCDALDWPPPPRATPAWIVGVEPSPYRKLYRIRARADALDKGLPVVAGHSLLGVISRVDGREAYFLRIDDRDLKLDVEVLAGDRRLPGIATGAGDGEVLVEYVQGASEVERGAPVFVSAYDPKIPPGLLIGWVETREDSNKDGVWELRIRPAALERSLAQVEVLSRR